MPDSTDPLYRDQDIHAILKRAAELQHTEADVPSKYDGLTLGELQQVAAEAGIDPQHVQAAAAEMGRTRDAGNGGFHAWGGPLHVEVERTLPGPITDAQWAEVVAALKQAYGVPGETRQIGQVREWHHAEKSNPEVFASLAPRGDGSLLQLSARYAGMAVGVHASVLAVGLVGALLLASLLSSLLWSPIAFVAVLGIAYLIGRAFFGYVARHQQDKARHLADRLERIVQPEASSANQASRTSTATTSTSAINLPDERETPGSTARPNRRRTRS